MAVHFWINLIHPSLSSIPIYVTFLLYTQFQNTPVYQEMLKTRVARPPSLFKKDVHQGPGRLGCTEFKASPNLSLSSE